MVTVVSGANSNTLALDGKTVGYVRDTLGSVLNIASGSVATIDGEEVFNDYELAEGETLRFSRATAEKG